MTEANRCAGALLAITRSLNHMCGIWGIFCVERKLHLLAAAVAAVMIDWKMLHIPVLCGHCHCGCYTKKRIVGDLIVSAIYPRLYCSFMMSEAFETSISILDGVLKIQSPFQKQRRLWLGYGRELLFILMDGCIILVRSICPTIVTLSDFKFVSKPS